MSQAESLSDEEFFFAYLPEYLDDQLAGEPKDRFDQILSQGDGDWDERMTDYGIAKGHLQLKVQDLFVDESLTHQLHVLVEDDAARASHEADDIEDYSRSATLNGILRGSIIAALVALVVGLAYYFLGPKREPAFAALDSLVYESVVMIEDPEGRLDFPSSDLDELRDYFVQYPDLGFSPRNIKSPGANWALEGGTVIDYEVQNIMASQFRRGEDRLFIYLFQGELSDFPKAEPGNYEGLLYQAYASDYFNVVVWSLENGLIGMLVGTQSPEELAKAAMAAVGI